MSLRYIRTAFASQNMVALMISWRHYFEIFNAVISLVSVAMVNIFRSEKSSPKFSFHCYSMLEKFRIAVSVVEINITSSWVDRSSSIKRWIQWAFHVNCVPSVFTLWIAKMTHGPFHSERCSEQLALALRARDDMFHPRQYRAVYFKGGQ